MATDETFLITGFPGFIANRLLRSLAATGCRFVLLVQPMLQTRAQELIARIAAETKRSVDDFLIVHGDISHADLGLDRATLETIQQDVTRIFHLAAIYDLAIPQDVALRVNVAGTSHVNQIAGTLRRLRHYHHVSTCYVAGKREGVILETELDHNSGFRNFYEQSKYLAEISVDALKRELPVTIHRPSVVCGDSETGETAKYDGVYYLIHYLLRWPRGLSLLNIGNHDVALNLVPVDFVVAAMTALAFDDRAIGKTVQIADPHPLTTNQLFNEIAKSIDDRCSKVTVPPSWVQFFLMLPPAPRITGLPHHGVPYFFVKQTYDTQQAQQLLEPHAVHCPPFESYVDRIVDFAARHPTL
ncbi:MAG: SDR family oxidoreductase [Pyrinomonadaceae bacterium]